MRHFAKGYMLAAMRPLGLFVWALGIMLSACSASARPVAPPPPPSPSAPEYAPAPAAGAEDFDTDGEPADDADFAASNAASGDAADGVPSEYRERSDTDARALSDFRTELDQHGTWLTDTTYGTVWVPNPAAVGTDFAPYVTNGHWALNARGNWVWVSHYPFGHVVFHYGRWVWTGPYGWGWVPGYRYADAWVSWRVPYGPYAYVGWAPMAPEYVWVDGQLVWLDVYPTPLFVFIHSHYLFSPHVHYYVLHHHHVHDAVRWTRRYRAADPQKRSEPPKGPSLAAARVPRSLVPNATLRAGPSSLTPAASAKAAARGSLVGRPRIGSHVPDSRALRPSTWPFRGSRGSVRVREGSWPARGEVTPRTGSPRVRSSVTPRRVTPGPSTGVRPVRVLPPTRGGSTPKRVQPTSPTRAAPVPRVQSVPRRASPSRPPSNVRPSRSVRPRLHAGSRGE